MALIFLCFVGVVLSVLLAVAFVTLLERKLLGFAQHRPSPNRVAFTGHIQPILDGGKLLCKEFHSVSRANLALFVVAPVLAFVVMFFTWCVVPAAAFSLDIQLALLFLMVCMAFSVYSLLFTGWASNSKFALLGSLRALAQSVSYEIALSFILLSVVAAHRSFALFAMFAFNFTWVLVLSSAALLWYLSTIAESNRAPFDFAEGESELVSGFNVEFGSVGFVLIFVSEYGTILAFSAITPILFLPVGLFVASFAGLASLVLLLRAVYPRFRYDKLMFMAWFIFLPVAI